MFFSPSLRKLALAHLREAELELLKSEGDAEFHDCAAAIARAKVGACRKRIERLKQTYAKEK